MHYYRQFVLIALVLYITSVVAAPQMWGMSVCDDGNHVALHACAMTMLTFKMIYTKQWMNSV